MIGNISIDTTRYPDGRTYALIGGAALHVALAAARAGTPARPVAVIGADLTRLHARPWPKKLDLSHVTTAAGASCRFDITYSTDGQVVGLTAAYGCATALTAHVLDVLDGSACDHWHICCRRPLDVRPVLEQLVMAGHPFSLDFHLASAAEQIHAATNALPHAVAVFVNAAEYRILDDLVAVNELATVVVSDGSGAVVLLRHGRAIDTELPQGGPVTEVTGAGDTLAGAYLADILQGSTEQEALASAVTAATHQARDPGLPYESP
ncbi:PfkB family carbohydrate kinase [Nonomuraea angiospora]|uniref:Sugar/nucleoside kinase (Ribokinase family) n=1 Tax=Nonomuraea angiospora TaxID=46172 RepID=A0ABR9LVA0_9ACTN|nr:carbohydrate kinase family protein [Nonomuraea angiospora]MBE1584569.1 sugar/nucleoside kinase (ribokinase family) [Nonomuraea angiospora]